MAPPPNILYLNSHDTGRYVQPYGNAVPTPNIQWLADQGVMFRNGFCAAPSCSGSRAALLTGSYCHNNGMMGLAHRGFALYDYDQHIVRTLSRAGYHTELIGEQHVSADPGILGVSSGASLGAVLTQLDLSGTASLPDALKAIGEYARANPQLAWLRGRGWNQEIEASES